MRRVNVRTNSDHFVQCRESRCKLRRSLIKYKNSKTANHCFHSGMLAEKDMFSLVGGGGGRTFIIDVCPNVVQREAAGQRHYRNRHARTHHRLRGKAAIVGGARNWLTVS